MMVEREGILALQNANAIYLVVDNIDVLLHVARILDGKRLERPVELLLDGDLLTLIWDMMRKRVGGGYL